MAVTLPQKEWQIFIVHKIERHFLAKWRLFLFMQKNILSIVYKGVTAFYNNFINISYFFYGGGEP